MATQRRTPFNLISTQQASKIAETMNESVDSQCLKRSIASKSGRTGSSIKSANKWSLNGFGEPASATGKFSPEESAVIRDAIVRYCEARGIEPAKLCSECENRTELKGAWMQIARSLPDRSVQAVYRHGLRQLHPFKRGPWAEEECMLLLEYVARMGKRWSLIQAKMNRSADSCRDKHREIGANAEFVRGRWTSTEQELLVKLVWEFIVDAFPHDILKEAIEFSDKGEGTGNGGVRYEVHLSASQVPAGINFKLLGRLLDDYGKKGNNVTIPWSAISRQMVNRSRLSCFKKWQKLIGAANSSGKHAVVADGQPQRTNVNSMFCGGSKTLVAHANRHGMHATMKATMNLRETNSMTVSDQVALLHTASQTQNLESPATQQFYQSQINSMSLVDSAVDQSAFLRSLAERQRSWQERNLVSIKQELPALAELSKGNSDLNAAAERRSEADQQEDINLLESLVKLNYHKLSDVSWSTLSHSEGAYERWKQIMAEEHLDSRKSVVESAQEILLRWKLGLHLV